MGLALIIIGLILWLALGLFTAGVICLIVGVVLVFVPGAPYGYSTWHRR